MADPAAYPGCVGQSMNFAEHPYEGRGPGHCQSGSGGIPLSGTVPASPELSASFLWSTARPALRGAITAMAPCQAVPDLTHGSRTLGPCPRCAARRLGPWHGWRRELWHKARHDAESTANPLARQQCTDDAHDGKLPHGGASRACRPSHGRGTAPTASRERAGTAEPVAVMVPIAPDDPFSACLPRAIAGTIAATTILPALHPPPTPQLQKPPSPITGSHDPLQSLEKMVLLDPPQ
ncbi:hypothetical protein MRX96_009429 [Rhipicephalus microplus]